MGELVGLLTGFLLTLFIYSYVLGDNPLYRLAASILVGASAGYASVVAVQQVLLPLVAQIRAAPTAPDSLTGMIPLLLGLLLFFKLARRTAPVGDGTVGAMIGIGAAVALVGTILGTLLPQVGATPIAGGIAGFIVALLTVCTLLYFQFTVSRDEQSSPARPGWQRPLAFAGRIVITITLGTLFANIFSTSLVLLSERLAFFVIQFNQIFGRFLS